ncbi:MAG: EAL domain-containing protein, partial [Pseudomonadota bacterium]|nr:EAL domain-containing protein [Pseudomonadota bacterium]
MSFNKEILAELSTSDPLQAPSILLVDNDPHQLYTLKSLLMLQGYTAHTATDCCSGAQMLKQHKYNLIILDLNQAEQEHENIWEDYRTCSKNCPILVSSRITSIESAIFALRRGAYDFISKPYEPELLIKRVANALNYQRIRTQVNLANQQAIQSRTWLKLFVEDSPDLLFTLDMAGALRFLNAKMLDYLGLSNQDLTSLPFRDFLAETDRSKFDKILVEFFNNPEEPINLKVNLNQEVTRSTSLFIKLLALDGKGEKSEIYCIAQNIEAPDQSKQRPYFKLPHSFLTDLPRRSEFEEELSRQIRLSNHSGRSFAVLILDIDQFQILNDTLGESNGEKLLIEIATRIKKCLPRDSFLAHMGSDQFAILLSNTENEEELTSLAGTLLNLVKIPFLIEEQEIFCRISLGITRWPKDGETHDLLIKNTILAMRLAKEKNSVKYQFYTPSIQNYLTDRLTLENNLRKAIERQEFILYFQPQVDISSGSITGVETLVRWQHPERQMIYPHQFIPVAEETGLIVPLGKWILNEACKQLRIWHDLGFNELTLAVNLSAQQIEQPDFVEMIMKTIDNNNLSYHHLELEITETDIMIDIENNIQKLKLLNGSGIKISLDDFG